jgi:hypothetical protein
MTNYKLQPFPTSSTRESRVRLRLTEPGDAQPTTLDDASFIRSWLVYDSEQDTVRPGGRVNWNVVLGLVLAIAVSAGFWTGLGLVIVHFWK